MIDIEAIKARLDALAEAQSRLDAVDLRGIIAAHGGYAQWPESVRAEVDAARAVAHAPADIGALVAEVERLQQVQPKRDYYASLGAAQERAAVVAWLRGKFPEWPAGTNGFADEIERGEHRREETK